MSGYSCRGFSIATLRHVKHTTLIKKICRIVEHATTVNRQQCDMSGYSCRGFSIATLRHVKHTTLIKKDMSDC